MRNTEKTEMEKLQKKYNLSHKDKIPTCTSKRILDLFVSVMLIVVFSPIILIIIAVYTVEMIFIKESRGPLLYKEPRISGGKVIFFYKFRTFKQSVIDAARKKNFVVHTKDLEGKRSNFTGLGCILNNIYLDELPQLISILKGEMSLVGPRPTNIEVTVSKRASGDYTKDLVISGLTGPYQSVKGEGFDQQTVDAAYIDYVRSHSNMRVLIKDIKILFKTIKILIRAKGI